MKSSSSARSKKSRSPTETIQVTMQDPSDGTMYLETFTLPSGPKGDPFHRLGGDRLWDAQEKAYDAMQAASAKEQQKLAKQALAISLDCSDAYVILSAHASTVEEAIRLCEEGVQAGERVLGKKNLKEYKGMFWGIVETRPYMRAKEQLADCLWKIGKQTEAMSHYQELLELNPNDNQGVRYSLLSCFLETKQAAQAETLLNQYPDEASALWGYGRALLFFQQEGAGVKANKALREALKTNKHIADYVLGIRSIPEELPETYSFGSEEEALCYIDPILSAWKQTEGAIEWLRLKLAPALTRKTAKKGTAASGG